MLSLVGVCVIIKVDITKINSIINYFIKCVSLRML